jgi:ribonucleotide monophosphatase NagD (HAD superfamily)
VLTSAIVTAEFLAGEHPVDPLFVVGSPVLRETLRERNLVVTDDPDAAAVVVGSFDRAFDYDRLAESLWALAGDDMRSAFVLTGVDGRDDVEAAEYEPTYVLDSLADVGDALDDATSL